MSVVQGQQYNIGEKPTVIAYTFTLIPMLGHQNKNDTLSLFQDIE